MKNRRFTLLVVFAVLVAAASALFAARLLGVGIETVIVPEGGGVVQTGRAPIPAALAPLLASLLVVVGILAGRLRLAWAGASFLALMGLLWIFSIGLYFLVAGVLLISLLALMQRYS